MPTPMPPRSHPQPLAHSSLPPRNRQLHVPNAIFETRSTHTCHPLSLAASTPHILQQPIPLTQPIQRIIALAHRAHEAAQRVDLVLARIASVLVDFADGDLYRGVVFGFDDAVGGAAFAGDVAVLKIN
jgi:hypothetical protein